MSVTANHVELLWVNGGDRAVALAAWHSTGKELTPEREARIPEFLWALWHAKPEPHRSPFRFCQIVFRVHGDIASHIHMLKHRVGVEINTRSARYAELREDDQYVPVDLIEVDPELAFELEARTSDDFEKYHTAIRRLEPKVGRQRAKELARYFLPYNIQLDWVMQVSMEAFKHLVDLRGPGSHAQLDIQDIVDDMLDLARKEPSIQHSLAAMGLK
jgi:flavin-dependent thymidylate synthase